TFVLQLCVIFLRTCRRSWFLCLTAAYTEPHSFPTRRSSDLNSLEVIRTAERFLAERGRPEPFGPVMEGYEALPEAERRERAAARSEEHTSELQSRFDLVCRLLLEKKKTPTKQACGSAS